jgi:hypothetical protein
MEDRHFSVKGNMRGSADFRRHWFSLTEVSRLQRPLMAGAILLAALSRPVMAQSAQRDSVLAVVQTFFAAMEAQDTARLRSILDMDGHTVAVGSLSDTSRARLRPLTEFLAQLPRSPDRWRERIWDPQVLIHGALAVVWAPYDFYHGSKFSHCGVDSFTLTRRQDGWRIIDVAFTIEPTGCAPSPLGPRPD